MVLSNTMITLNIPYTNQIIVKSCMNYCFSKYHFYIFYLQHSLQSTIIKPKKLLIGLIKKPFLIFF